MLGWLELKWISCICWETAIVNPGVGISKQWPGVLGTWLSAPIGQLDKYCGWGHCREWQNLIKVHREIQTCCPKSSGNHSKRMISVYFDFCAPHGIHVSHERSARHMLPILLPSAVADISNGSPNSPWTLNGESTLSQCDTPVSHFQAIHLPAWH